MFFIESVEPAAIFRLRLDLFDDVGFVVGHVKLEHPKDDTAYIFSLKVFREFRGLGYARTLLEEIIKRCGRWPDISAIDINACPFDDAPVDVSGLVSFYEKYGFRVFAGTDNIKHMRKHVGK
jgi:ribosomal protein S18 acetylase RimI-like enzyme